MATATVTTSISTPALDAAIPLSGADVMKRGIKRVLPCKLTEQEFMRVAKTRVDKEALLDQIEEDFANQKKKHNDQVDELEGEIGKMRKELHSGEQDRTVPCVEIFVRAGDGTGWVHTLRMDTLGTAYAMARGDGMSHAEAADLAREKARVEMRPATPTETQRHLPDLEAATDRNTPLLDAAAARQGKDAAKPDEPADDGVPAGAEPGDEDDGLVGEPGSADEGDDDADRAPANETPAQKAARESEQGRSERRAGKGKRGGKGGK